ncbi:MAG: type II toxin-antitoxin system VapC family toxin [Terracidiphilus sp.]
MKIVLDASMALGWLIHRADAGEAALARQAFVEVSVHGADVPGLWFAEVANTLLVFERAKRLSEADSTKYLSSLALLAITEDDLPCASVQSRALDLGRRFALSAYDATYLELAMRNAATLATFDRKLVEAARTAGVNVFGDPV